MAAGRTAALDRPIGILGGGQLGRMLAIAAARLGISCHIYCPDPASPAFDCAAETTCASYDDLEALKKFAGRCALVTYEFENIAVEAVEAIGRLTPVRPGPGALSISQDRLSEKQFLAGLGLPVAPFFRIDSAADIVAAQAALGGDGVLKTRRLGYDGKGQTRIGTSGAAEAATAAWAQINAHAAHGGAILEGFVDFERELSVILARGPNGEIADYDLAENSHRDHILHTTRVPARAPDEIAHCARQMGRAIADALDYVGVLAVEFFLCAAPQAGLAGHTGAMSRLVINEIAPRVHNSGHWTLDACAVSQFEQHIRAICGLPLGSAARHSDALMENLIGGDMREWRRHFSTPDTAIHLYGKAESRAGRKMGHICRLSVQTPKFT